MPDTRLYTCSKCKKQVPMKYEVCPFCKTPRPANAAKQRDGGSLLSVLIAVTVIVGLFVAGTIGVGAWYVATADQRTIEVQQIESQPVRTQTPAHTESQSAQEEPDGILLGTEYVKFEHHSVTSGIGSNYLFDITVGKTKKSTIEAVSSDELTKFINGIDFTGTNGNAVLMFEDGTGIQFMEASKGYTADYGYIDVSENEFTMTERLGAIWNDTGEGWYYRTVEEMMDADEAEQEQNQPTVTRTPMQANAPSAKPSQSQAQTAQSQATASQPVPSNTPQPPVGNDRTSKFASGMVLATTESDNGGDPVYHTKNCRSAQKIDAGSELWYSSAQDAINDGRRICGNCDR